MTTNVATLKDIEVDIQRIHLECDLRFLQRTCEWYSNLLSVIPINESKAFDASILMSTSFVHVLTHYTLYSRVKSCFAADEFQRCHVILSGHSDTFKNAFFFFLWAFAKYKAIVKMLEENRLDIRIGVKPKIVSEFMQLKKRLEAQMNNHPEHFDAYCGYLLGVICAALQYRDSAFEHFRNSINLQPLLWCCWNELLDLTCSLTDFPLNELPNHIFRLFFDAALYHKLHLNEKALGLLDTLCNHGYHNSSYINTIMASAYHELCKIEQAAKTFELIREHDEYSLDGMDIYSNILYVKEDRTALAYLANHFLPLDKYRPECCFIAGNYYSLRGDHSKSLTYFQRALKLKPSYHMVHTLIGHEYSELHNSRAAIISYRRALAHNSVDFRAWYGLGLCFELQNQPSYALNHFQEAVRLQPTDSRCLFALGKAYEAMDRLEDATKCYWRAYAVGDKDGHALQKLALCFARSDDPEYSAAAYVQFITHCKTYGVHDVNDLAGALIALADYYYQRGNLDRAREMAYRCLDYQSSYQAGRNYLDLISNILQKNTASIPAEPLNVINTSGKRVGEAPSENPNFTVHPADSANPLAGTAAFNSSSDNADLPDSENVNVPESYVVEHETTADESSVMQDVEME